MSFFDKKEEVLSTELTQYGKKLLRDGKLNPTYYAFYDDDILYDVNYAGFSESHTETRSRIKDSVYIKPTYTFATKFLEDKEIIENELGNSSLLYPYAPAWKIMVLNNQFSACSITPASASMSITYKSVVKDNKEKTQEDLETKYRTSVYNDDSYLEIKRNFVLLDILEENSFEEVGRDKLELEFFIIENGIETKVGFEEIQKYLDILVDNEIDSAILCQKVRDQAENLFENVIEQCNNYNNQLILGKDSQNTNLYDNFDSDRGKIC